MGLYVQDRLAHLLLISSGNEVLDCMLLGSSERTIHLRRQETHGYL